MPPKTNPKAVPSEMEPPLIGALLDRDIMCRSVPDGVLVIDHYALLDLLEGTQEEATAHPSWGNPDAPRGSRRPKPLDPDAPNPVGIAQEYCQGLGKPVPAYSFESIGTENMPMFRCVARAFEREGSGESHNKAQAKEQAARALLRSLQAAKRSRHG